MRFEPLAIEAQPLSGALPAFQAAVAAAELRAACERAQAGGARLIALWGSDETERGAGFAAHLALAFSEGLLWLSAALDRERPRLPDLADLYPAAGRMQRAARDLLGIEIDGGDRRKWLRHGAWPADEHPLRKDFDATRRPPLEADAYPFVRVEGEGVHEIPVGPVHAGTIEPGHFRFSIVGEKILRLEERLGYKHKGIEKRFESLPLAEGARLAGRVSGDSTVAYAWAWAMALEGACGAEPPPRALVLRAILLELERIANHLGDLGYLGNDVALAFGFSQFWRLKEDLLRLNARLFGHRYLMDTVLPGGVARDLDRAGAEHLVARLAALRDEVATLRGIYDEHAGAQDRFIMTGQVPRELAARMGLTGFAGRASGLPHDLRADYPMPPWEQLEVRVAAHARGDVAARASVRFDELLESIRLIETLAGRLPRGETLAPLPPCPGGRRGVGWIEGWRGDVLIALDTADGGCAHRVHPHDPSWRNWPLLERAVMGNIVPDFPLINKSFNLSYSGQDL
ncbi:MAG TPA: NADH-quinone oxidoreductase subunit C [Burkholderiales bacterium]|nr:NADH-quinone oxidoreductase subunit C [Burkholderiales bacterium]